MTHRVLTRSIDSAVTPLYEHPIPQNCLYDRMGPVQLPWSRSCPQKGSETWRSSVIARSQYISPSSVTIRPSTTLRPSFEPRTMMRVSIPAILLHAYILSIEVQQKRPTPARTDSCDRPTSTRKQVSRRRRRRRNAGQGWRHYALIRAMDKQKIAARAQALF